MRKPTIPIAVAATLVLGAAVVHANFDVDVMYDHKADFSVYATYRWETGPSDDSPNATMVDERIKKAAEKRLADAGLRPASDGEQPDLLLTYYGGIEDDLLIEGVRYEIAPHVVWTGAAPLGVTRSHQVGTLIIDFADARTETVVWSGVVTSRARTGTDLRDRIEKAVRKVLRQYPPD